MKKTLAILVVGMLLISGVSVMRGSDEENDRAEDIRSENDIMNYLLHAPIRINNDSDLAASSSSGNGTVENPYVIENYKIDASGYSYGIFIGNTTESFTIRNCLIYNASYSSSPYSVGAGIELYNNSGYIFIFNNTLNGNRYGVYAYDAAYKGQHNYMEGNRIGLFSYNSSTQVHNSTLIPSQYQENEYYIPIDSYPYTGGDYLDYLANATYTKLFNITNEVYFDTHIWGYSDAPDLDLAIFLDGKDGSPVDGQAQKAEFVQYCADADADEEVELNLPASGTYIIKVAGYDVTGNPGHFDMQITTRSGYEGLLAEYSRVEFVNTTIQNVPYGLVSIDSEIAGKDTDVSGASYGAVITNSVTGNLSSIVMEYGTYGIYMQNCTNVNIYGNILLSNSEYGIYADDRSNGNRIWRNELYMNKNTHHYYMDSYPSQAFDGGINEWNYSGIGNYWLDWAQNNDTNDMNHDGIVDWPYHLDGSLDHYPLKNSSYDKMGPSFNVVCPLESSTIHDPLPVIQIEISDDLVGVDKESIQIWLDGSLLNDTLIPDNPDYTYVLTTMPTTKIGTGIHFINISARDVAGNPSDFSWNFTVSDTDAPKIVHNGCEMNSVGNSTEISAEVEDDFSVQTVTLWYEGIGETIFTSTPMTFDGKRWVGTIPPQYSTGTVNYYITAFDGTNTATTQVYSTNILSDRGMVIRHYPVSSSEIEMVIPIKADVVGASHVTLWYRVGTSTYVPVSMDNGGVGETYYGYILPQKIGESVYYYIEATNVSGSITSPLDASSPYEINITGAGTLRVSMQSDMHTMNPLSAGDLWTWDVIGWCFDGLTWQNSSDYDHVEPLAAEWFHHGPNNTWAQEPYPDNDNNTDYVNWTVKLRDGIKWHDWESQTGDDQYVRASDVIFSLRLQADVPRYAGAIDPIVAKNPDGSIMYGRDIDANTTNGIINGVNVSFEKDYPNLPVILVTSDPDNLTLHYRLRYEYVGFTTDTLSVFTYPERIWKNHIADKLSWNDPQALISFGPFEFKYWNSTAHVSEISAFEDYFGKKSDISGIKFTVMEGEDKSSAGVISLTRHKVDYLAWKVGIPQAEYSYDFSDVEIEKSGDLGFFYLAFNMRDPDFGYAGYNETDVQNSPPTYHGNYTDIGKPFRLAIAHLINKTYIVEKLLKGYGNVENSVVTEANLFWHDPSVASYEYSPTEASAILDAAGYVDTDGNGVRELPNRGEAPIYILTPPRYYDPVRAKIGKMIQENASAIGLNVVAMPTDFGTIVDKINNQDFDMYILGWSIGGPTGSASAPCDFFGSKADGGGNNYPGYHNESFDQLCDNFSIEYDNNKRRQIDFQMQEAIGYDQPYVTMYSKTILEAHTDEFVGWFSKYGGIYNRESMANITSPDTIEVASIPHSVPAGENTDVSAVITSHVPIYAVWLNYTDVDGVWHNVSIANEGNDTYVSTIPGQPHPGIVSYCIYVVNSYNRALRTEDFCFEVTQDIIAPSVHIDSPEEGELLNSSSVTVVWTGSDNVGVEHYEVRIDGGTWLNVGAGTSHQFTGLSNGTHAVDVKAVDYAGNENSTNVTFTVLSWEYIVLHRGWNLITVRWSGEAVEINTAIEGNWTRAMVHINGLWYTYNKDRDARFNLGFPEINNSIGLWVYSPSGGNLTSYYRETPVNTTIHLHKGWNLVGYPSGHDRKVSDALLGISWTYLQTADADGNIYSLSSSDYLIVGRAYWIYVTDDCVWTVEW